MISRTSQRILKCGQQLKNVNFIVLVSPARNATSQSSKNQVESKNNDRPLYLDAQATSPIDPRVLDAMLPYMTNMYGNPHSRTHAYGWESESAVEKARKVTKLIYN